MIPVLYNHAEKDFISNGLGRLTDCISCTVTEERNGEFKCEFEYPIFGRHYADLKEGCIIYVTHDNSGIPQPFDIYSRSVPVDGVVTFEAAHISYRLSNVILKPYTATSCASALEGIPGAAMNDCEFQFTTDKNVNADFALSYPLAAKAILCGVEGSILDVYGTGEYRYDKFLVDLKLHRGVDTDVQIRYGKNLVEMTDEYDSSTSYNAVVPYWISPDTNEVVTLPEYAVVATEAPGYTDFWTDDNGAFITDENDERFEFDYVVLKPATLDLSQVFETKPTDAQMRAKARESADEHAAPSRSISVDFVQLWQSEEYSQYAPLQQLNLCDTAEVIYYGESVRLKVISTEYDALRDRYTRIELGDPPESYADVVTGELSEKLKIVPSKSQMQSAITTATEKITGVQGGNVVIDTIDGKPWRILIMDTDDVETAVNVLQINNEGIGFSRTGVNGEYATAWTIDGEFVADFITAGVLKGLKIMGGRIDAIDGNAYWDLDNSKFYSENDTNRLSISGGQIIVARPYNGINHNVAMFHTSLSTNADSTAQSDTVYGYGIITYADSFLMLGRRTGVGKAKFCVVINGNNNQKILNRYQDVIVAGTAAFNEDVTFYLAASFSGTTSFYGVSSHYGNDRFYTAPLLDSGFVIRHDGSTVLEVGTGQWTNGHIYTLFDTVGSSSDKIIVIKARGGYTPTDAQMDNYGIFLEASAVHVGGSLYVATEVSGQTVTQRSDERLKNIRPYESAYDDVLDDLEPITFTWKENDSQEHIGLGARKTRAILDRHGLDDAALSHDLGGDYVINYNELTVMLLKRVQDLTKRVEELEAQLCR